MELIYYPNSLLMAKTRALEKSEENLAENIRAMFDIMYHNKGIGLAGPQAGWSVKLFILNLSGEREGGREMIFINPRILSRSGTATEPEGCLSFPGLFVDIRRDQEIEVAFEDEEFNTQRLECDGLLSRAVQHEIDHLDNILLVHRMSHTEKVKNKKLLEDLKKRHGIMPGS